MHTIATLRELAPHTTSVSCISFDVWMTLIRPNPKSREARARIVARALGVDPDAELVRIMGEVSKQLDIRSEETGLDFGCEHRLKLLCDAYRRPHFGTEQMAEVVQAIQDGIRHNPPLLIDPETPAILAQYAARGISLALISNTGYPQAEAMREVLSQLHIAEYMQVMAFSGELNLAKPSPAIYEHVRTALNVPKQQMLHVGDSVKADLIGATSFGIKAVLFKQNN